MLIDGQDIFKNLEPVQFPKDEIRNEKDRIVRGWMSVEVKDRQGEIVPVDDLKRSLNIWMKRGAPIMDEHSNRHVGEALNWKEATHPDTQTPGISIDYRIFDDYSTDDQVWKEIKSGKRKGLSMGGRALGKKEKKTDAVTGESAEKLSNIETYEVSSVREPANQFALNEVVNLVAKSMNIKKEDMEKLADKLNKEADLLFKDLQNGYAVKDIMKPFAGFETFNECKIAQGKKGHSEESSNRICGFLQARSEGKKAYTPDGAHRHTEEDPEGLHSHPEIESKVGELKSMEKGKYKEDKKQVRDPAAVCGNIWFNGTEEQRGSFEGGTGGRGRDEKPPKAWMDDCLSTVGKAKSVEKFMLSPDKIEGSTIKNEDAQKSLKGEKPENKIGETMEGKDIGKQVEKQQATKQEEMKPPSVDEKIPAWAQAIMDRLAAVEEELGVGKAKKQDEKPEEKEPKEEKPKEEEKKKIDEGNIEVKPPENPKSETEGKTVLPKAEAGETDESAPPETDKVQLMEKAVAKEVSKKLESLGINIAKKATTPRPTSAPGKEVVKSNVPNDVAFEYVKKAREGKVDMAKMNRDLRNESGIDRSDEIKKFIEEGE
jgi:hypothetical protein